MRSLLDIFGSREFDDWRDREAFKAAKALDELAAGLILELDPALKSASWKEGLLTPQSFITDTVAPRLRTASERVVETIIAGANNSLAQLAEYQAVWTRRPEAPIAAAGAFEGAGDLALAVGPIASGVAIAAALPGMAVTTSAGLLGTGLFATTMVSWPVVAVGGAAVGIALATGALSAGRVWGAAEARLRRNAAAHIEATLIRGTSNHPAVLEQLVTLFSDAVMEARKRR